MILSKILSCFSLAHVHEDLLRLIYLDSDSSSHCFSFHANFPTLIGGLVDQLPELPSTHNADAAAPRFNRSAVVFRHGDPPIIL